MNLWKTTTPMLLRPWFRQSSFWLASIATCCCKRAHHANLHLQSDKLTQKFNVIYRIAAKLKTWHLLEQSFFRLMVPDGMWGKIAGTWRLPWNPLSWPPAKVALLNTCKGSGLIVSLCRHCGILGVYIYNARAALQDRIDQGTCAKAGVSYLIDLWFLMWSHYCRAAISACGSMYPPGTYIYIYMYS